MPASPDPALVDALLRLGAATLGESGATPLPPRLRPVWVGAAVAGPALPVRCTPGDNLAIHVAVARARPGEVLVSTMGDQPELGYWGEVLTTGAQARGVAGLITDSCVRDTAALAAHGFPVFSSGVALPGATKHHPGTVGRPIELCGVPVGPGDWVVADGDGVVVLAGDRLDEVIAAGEAREAKEATMFQQLEAGATTVELLDLDTSPIEGP